MASTFILLIVRWPSLKYFAASTCGTRIRYSEICRGSRAPPQMCANLKTCGQYSGVHDQKVMCVALLNGINFPSNNKPNTFLNIEFLFKRDLFIKVEDGEIRRRQVLATWRTITYFIRKKTRQKCCRSLARSWSTRKTFGKYLSCLWVESLIKTVSKWVHFDRFDSEKMI